MLKTIALLMTIGATVVLPAEAQDAAQRGQGSRGRVARGAVLSAGEVVNMLDAYAVLQAQEMLPLAEAQYGPFVTRLKALQDTRRRNQQARNRIIHRLREIAGPQAPQGDDNVVRNQLKTLREHDDKSATEIRRAYDAVDELLDPRQQARFRLLEERLEARKIDLLMRARQGARQ